jgi:chitinase
MINRFLRFLTLASLFTLVACSGGSLDSDTDQPSPLVLVNAGSNQTVSENTTVSLNAEASGQTALLTYAWSSVPALTLTHSDSNSPTASFLAPVTTESLLYTLTLLVTDGAGNQASDSVNVTVSPVNESPTAVISIQLPDNTFQQPDSAGIAVVLDGSNSVDTDSAASLEAIASWRWQQTAGADVLGSVSLDGDSIAFNTPILDQDSALSFSLTVTDQEAAEHTATISLQILSASNTLPVVDAGVDHQVFAGETILLTGTATSSIPSALPLDTLWLTDSQLSPVIASNSQLKTQAVAPAVDSQQIATFTLQVVDGFGNQVEDSFSVTIKPLPINPINDTGVLLQANDIQFGAEYQADFPGQDGQRGQDIIHSNGLLEKAGRGDQGFDFTRLDNIGDEVDDAFQDWSCVRDNVTGLVWEVKTDDASLHSSEHTYSWFATTNTGGFEGDSSGADASCTLATCSTDSFIAAANTEGLCNFFDWRLPTHNELLSIVHYGKTQSPLIDTGYFTHTTNDFSSPIWYWTSLSSADGVGEDGARNAWAIDFATGNDNFLSKSSAVQIRLVRGGR